MVRCVSVIQAVTAPPPGTMILGVMMPACKEHKGQATGLQLHTDDKDTFAGMTP